VVPELIANGRYPHPWLGVAGYSLGPELAKNLNLPVEKGVLVARVYNNSPAGALDCRARAANHYRQPTSIGGRRYHRRTRWPNH
jgi:hypothetical protein